MSDQRRLSPQPVAEGETMNGWRATSKDTGSGPLLAVDGQVMTARDWQIYMDGFIAGRAEGIAAGRAQADAEAAARHRAAAQAVLGVALMPPRDAEADRRRAERSRAYWARRRGEGGAA